MVNWAAGEFSKWIWIWYDYNIYMPFNFNFCEIWYDVIRTNDNGLSVINIGRSDTCNVDRQHFCSLSCVTAVPAFCHWYIQLDYSICDMWSCKQEKRWKLNYWQRVSMATWQIMILNFDVKLLIRYEHMVDGGLEGNNMQTLTSAEQWTLCICKVLSV